MKKRLAYLGMLLFVIVLGLLSRKLATVPLAVGDGLWAVAVYLAWRVFIPDWQAKQVFGLALFTAFAVEFSQLLTWSWLVELRQTTLGHLLLGQGFLWSDLLAYSVGLLVVVQLDQLLLEKKK